MKYLLVLWAVLIGVCPPLLAEPKSESQDPDSQAITKARELRAQDKSPSGAAFLEMLKHPKLEHVALAPQSTVPLKGRELARVAASAYVRVGWVYKCTRCTHWHFDFAGGYAIAQDTIATARHVVTPPESMQRNAGFPVIVRGENEILPIISVIAADDPTDTAVIRVDCNNLSPLPLTSAIEVGDPVYCLSDPDGNRGIFTAGIVNHIDRPAGPSRDELANSLLTVSTDWAPGSSGSAILDACGNAVGHVSTILPITCEGPGETKRNIRQSESAVVMSLHQAVPTSCVRALLEQSE